MSKEYLENLIKRNDYEKENQNYLKMRVLKTFENLIKTFFNRNIYDLKNSLDLGSADGSFVKVLKENGFNALGLDIKDLNFENDRFTQKDDTFDLITAISVIEHLSNPNNFLTEVKKSFEKRWIFYSCNPNWKFDMKNFYNDPTHIKPYTTTSINFLLEVLNLKI